MEFKDLKKQYENNKIDINNAINNVINNADFIDGVEVDILEKRLSEYVGTKHCITCANGTDAMVLVLMAWNIGEGDAVFVPNFTFFATAEAVAFRGAVPIFIDVDWNTFNIDPNKLEIEIIKVIKENILRPKLIIPVDLFGLPADFLEIEKIAKKYNLKILEDAAQGFGGAIGEKKACSFGDASTTSFFPVKPLGCYGDGGAIFTDNTQLAEVLKSLKTHGKGANKYDNIRIGMNSRLDTIQAAILNVKFSLFITDELSKIRKVAKWYNQELEILANYFETPHIPNNFSSSYAQYTIKLKQNIDRNKLQTFLLNSNIPTMIYYAKSMHQQSAFQNDCVDDDNFKVSTTLVNQVISLPIHPYITLEDVKEICMVLKKYFENTLDA